MSRFVWLVALGMLAVVAGCSSESTDPQASSGADSQFASGNRDDAPKQALHAFLEAVRTGQDTQAESLLTPLARQRTQEAELIVTPPGRDTASFSIGSINWVADDGVHIETQWTDVDETGSPQTDDIVWMLRKEAEGWRVAGMGAKPFPEKARVYLNFEDPDDMKRKLTLIDQEIQRQATEAARLAAQQSATPTTIRQAQVPNEGVQR